MFVFCYDNHISGFRLYGVITKDACTVSLLLSVHCFCCMFLRVLNKKN